MKTTISHTEYLQLLGLSVIGGQHYRKLTEVRDAIYEMLETTEDSNEDGGWIGDTIWGDDRWDVNGLLKKLKIEVRPPTKQESE